MKIEDEIQQSNFENEYHKTHINILFTASWLSKQVTLVLKPYKISRQQFNILRIMRGQHPKSVNIKLLSQRMIDKMSNASRIVDKLERKGLVERSESKEDRRRVDIQLTKKGQKIVEEASKNITKGIKNWFKTISPDESLVLSKLLDRLRQD